MLVTLETVKFFQAIILGNDKNFRTYIRDSDGKKTDKYIGCSVQASSLNEELGQINHIFSDKTGTLTMNKMVFHSLLLNNKKYGDIEPSKDDDSISHDIDLLNLLKTNSADGDKARLAMECMMICHEAVFDHNSILSSSSPEEIAFLNFINQYNYIYDQPSISKSQVTVNVNEMGVSKSYQNLAKFDFTSDRKRMSVAIQKGDIVYLYTKGADDIIKDYLKDKSSAELVGIDISIQSAAKKGLRTMMLAYKTIDINTWNAFDQKYKKARSFDNFKTELPKLQAEIENDLILIGAVALEDKLQNKVPESISFIRQAGIKFWVITGDKTETAISVARSAAIVSEDMELIKFIDPKDIQESMFIDINLKLNSLPEGKKTAGIVSGSYMTAIHNLKTTNLILFKEFVDLLMRTEVAVFSRISPRQKQEVVKMVRDYDKNIVTLAIGDGANDVNMINAAHIGIGIKGVEGHQAARASDYNFGEFKHLVPLMFCFGRESYRKNATLILYNFYKNILLVTPQFWFGFFNFFSGQTPFESISLQLFNTFFAFIPIFLYGIFDVSFDRDTFLTYPKLYKTGIDGIYFNIRKFIKNFTITFVIALYLIYGAFITFDWNPTMQGHTYGMWIFGNMLYMSVIIIVNAKILTISNSLSLLLLLSILLSIGFYLMMLYMFNFWRGNVLFNVVDEIFYRKDVYIFLFFVFCVCIFEYLIDKMEYHFTITPYEIQKIEDSGRKSTFKNYKVKRMTTGQHNRLGTIQGGPKMEMIEENDESKYTQLMGDD